MTFSISRTVSSIVLLACLLAITELRADSTASPTLQLHLSGNKLVDINGSPVVLHGVDRSGTEYECIQGKGFFDGPSDRASVTAMKSWDINAVRVPLNEACWNGESYVDPPSQA